MGKENPANRETDADAEEDAAEPDVMIHIHLQRMVDGDRAVARCGATLEAAKAHSEWLKESASMLTAVAAVANGEKRFTVCTQCLEYAKSVQPKPRSGLRGFA